MAVSSVFVTLIALSTCLASQAKYDPFPYNPGFDIRNVAKLAKSLPSHSWEYGLASQALLELHDPAYSVFGDCPFPPPTLSPKNVKSLEYASGVITIGQGRNALADGDGAVGDPCSLGPSAILLGKTNLTFGAAADDQLNYTIHGAPRFKNGAISQRYNVIEAWADFGYMGPPFVAYYAADTDDTNLLYEAYRQCEHYREILQAETAPNATYAGLWSHIIGPQSPDLGLWSTGNAWAAGGMARVLATIMKVPFREDMEWAELAISDLTNWIQEIVNGAIGSPVDDNGLLRNYLNDTVSDHGFGEISGTSMIAAVVYRMAVLQPDTFTQEYVHWAEGVRILLGQTDPEGKPFVNGTTGVVSPAVNPLGWGDTNPFLTGSPEGQNFVVLLYAAWRDYRQKMEEQ